MLNCVPSACGFADSPAFRKALEIAARQHIGDLILTSLCRSRAECSSQTTDSPPASSQGSLPKCDFTGAKGLHVLVCLRLQYHLTVKGTSRKRLFNASSKRFIKVYSSFWSRPMSAVFSKPRKFRRKKRDALSSWSVAEYFVDGS